MGIGNTTAASAIVAVMTGAAPAAVTGHGTGIDDATHRRKVAVIERAIARNAPDPADPIGVLAAVGGLEIGALVGVILGAVAGRVPVVLDGFITGAAALLAADLAPRVVERVIAAHRSVEPGHAIVLDRLGLRPVLDLDLRLGEGTGAALAIQLIDAAVRLRDGMATFTRPPCPGRPTAVAGRNPVVTDLVLVRHGPTSWTGRRYCGRSDPPLDAAGLAAAQVAGRRARTDPRARRPDRHEPGAPGARDRCGAVGRGRSRRRGGR